MIFLICPHSPSGAAHPWAHVYISGKSPRPILHNTTSTYIYVHTLYSLQPSYVTSPVAVPSVVITVTIASVNDGSVIISVTVNDP